MRISPFSVFGVIVAVSFITTVHAAEHTKESLAVIKKNIDGGTAVLVDVRERSEWDDGHIADAYFLPLSTLQDGITKEKLKVLPKDKVLYIHCAVGKRALAAANMLERQGYSVKPIKPGFKEMIAAGYPKAKD
ncbi:MAG: rhodanese-like domain-containing protein [Planctomycetota bacterium]